MQKIIAVLSGILVALLVSEIGLRLIAGHRIEPTACRKRDPLLDQSLVPNTNCIFKTSEWNVDFKVNSQGLRDTEHSLQKPQNTYRIMILGDSFVEGFGVQLEDTFGKIVERSLTKFEDKNVEVINAGVVSWSPISEYIYLLKWGLAYKPDLVILNFNVTDFHDDLDYYSRITGEAKEILTGEKKNNINPVNYDFTKSTTATEIFNPPGVSGENLNDPATLPFLSDKIKFFLNTNFYTYRALSRGFKLATGRANTVQVSPLEERGDIQKDLFAATREEIPQNYDQLFTYPETDILRMKKLLAENNIDFMVALLPHGHVVNGREWSKGRKGWGFELKKTYSSRAFVTLTKWANANGVEIYDLTPAIREAAKNQKLYFDFDGHLNKVGNQIVAESYLSILSSKITE